MFGCFWCCVSAMGEQTAVGRLVLGGGEGVSAESRAYVIQLRNPMLLRLLFARMSFCSTSRCIAWRVLAFSRAGAGVSCHCDWAMM